MSAQIAEILQRPVWEGGRTLEVGEVIIFGIAEALIFFMGKVPLKSLWVWVALIMVLVAMIIF